MNDKLNIELEQVLRRDSALAAIELEITDI
jgi:hypothetical protein